MDYISLFIKGIIIGIGKIMPGVSGSMLAISLGVYERIMESISNVFRNFKINSKFLINIGTGIVLAIVLISRLIIYCLNNFYFPIMMLFIGLIIGGIIPIFKNIKQYISLKNIFLLIIPLVLFYFFSLLTDGINFNIKFTHFNCFLLGFLEALTMVIPGISGTAIMMMLGVYEEQLKMYSEPTYFIHLIIFMVGIFIGIFLISNFISKIITKYRIETYYLIIGFTISSLFLLFNLLSLINFSIHEFFVGAFLLMSGVFVSCKLK